MICIELKIKFAVIIRRWYTPSSSHFGTTRRRTWHESQTSSPALENLSEAGSAARICNNHKASLPKRGKLRHECASWIPCLLFWLIQCSLFVFLSYFFWCVFFWNYKCRQSNAQWSLPPTQERQTNYQNLSLPKGSSLWRLRSVLSLPGSSLPPGSPLHSVAIVILFWGEHQELCREAVTILGATVPAGTPPTQPAGWIWGVRHPVFRESSGHHSSWAPCRTDHCLLL